MEHDYTTLEDHYSIVYVGTGMANCVLSGLLSASGFPSLILDKSDKYGGECAKMEFEELKLCDTDGKPIDDKGMSIQWNVDRIVKFVYAGGEVVKMMYACYLCDHVDMLPMRDCFFVSNGALVRVPKDRTDVLFSSHLSFWDRKNLYSIVADTLSWEMDTSKLPRQFTSSTTMREAFKFYGLNERLQHLLGHVIALHPDDDYLDRSCVETFLKMKLFVNSFHHTAVSPFIYPKYGMSEIPQCFAMRAATFNSVFILNSEFKIEVDEAENVVKACHLGNTNKKSVKLDYVISDPFTFPQYVKEVAKIIRCICILDHPLMFDNTPVQSAQIVYPGLELKKKSDLYIGVLSSTYNVCSNGYYVALVATTMETDDPEKEIAPGLKLLGSIRQKHLTVEPMLVPIKEKLPKNLFITSTCDATIHYEGISNEIKEIYQSIAKKPLNLEEITKICQKTRPDS